MSQQGDVKLYQTDDDGDITVVNGVVEMSGGLETAAYLSLFGGNEDDDGRADNPKEWWGNLIEDEPTREYTSETQNLLTSLPATSGNLVRLEQAVKRDLAWMVSESVASNIAVSVSIPALNKVDIVVGVEALGEEFTFKFTENWRAAV